MRIPFFDPVHGIGLTVAAGSGRSFMELPGGDPRHAHLQLDVPSDTLIPTPGEPGPRLRSDTVFVPWPDLIRFADALTSPRMTEARLTEARLTEARLVDVLIVRRQADGQLQAEAAFSVGHRVQLELRCRTWWGEGDLGATARALREAVAALRPA